MNGKGNAKGWISCLVMLLIIVIAFRFMFFAVRFIIPIFIVVNVVRFLIWRRRMKKVQQQVHDFQNKNTEDQSRYCEAEFEVLDDE